jgi:branched-chain amino acid transport system substrate-binding protein
MRLGSVLTGVVVCALASAGSATADVNVYSSLPRQGTSAGQTRAVEQGIRLALADFGGRAGGLTVNYIGLDDSSRSNPGTADEEQTRRNAVRVAGDRFAVGYVGEFNSGGSKVSIPILNRAGILQVSPSNTYIGLTTGGPGTLPGDPERYYPTGRRTYARIVPNDAVQAAVLATLVRDSRCASVAFVWDGSIYGEGIVSRGRQEARRLGQRTSSTVMLPKDLGRELRSRARRVTAPCVLYGGVTGNGAVAHFRTLAAGHPRRRFFASDGVAETAFSHPRAGGIPASIGRRTLITVATLGVRDFPAEGQAMAARFFAAYRVRSIDPYAVYGYESMRIVLDAIARAAPRGNDRGAVLDAFWAAGARHGVLGTYSFDANGDTTQRRYGIYGISGGWVTYRRAIVAR